jgi:hypothetical protein
MLSFTTHENTCFTWKTCQYHIMESLNKWHIEDMELNQTNIIKKKIEWWLQNGDIWGKNDQHVSIK